MKLNDVIEKLKKLESKHGNLDVICVRDEGGYYFNDPFLHVVDVKLVKPEDHGEISKKSIVISRFKD